MDLKRLDTVKSCLLACVAAAIALPGAEAALPASAAAQGSQPGPQPATGGQQAPTDAGSAPSGDTPAKPGGDTPANGSGLVVPTGLLVHQVGSLSGNLPGGAANTRVAIERLDATRRTWVTIASAVTDASGSFAAHWRPDHIGKFTVRAVPSGASAASGGQQPQALSAQLTVYRAAIASWFGPGFYGQRTACGEMMSPTLLGVAHRSLPCGTLVELSYGGHEITVPVVDRGPYRSGVSWDLTTATSQALGLDQNARIGALALRTTMTSPSTTTGTAPSTSTGTSPNTSAGSTAGPTGAKAASTRN
jgi:rare lipoprotein A (peptidoglycan hydrolase)